MIIIRDATIVMAFVCTPMQVDNHNIYLVEFKTPEPLAEDWIWRHPTTGTYRAWSRTQPTTWNADHTPQHLDVELAPGSIVNVAAHRQGSALILNSLEILKHDMANPFHDAA